MTSAVAILAAALTATLTSASHVALAGTEVRLADVATVRGPGAGAAARLGIARISPGKSVRLGRAQIAQLARRAVPAIELTGQADGEIMLEAPRPTPAGVSLACFEAVDPIPARGPVTRKDLRPAQCSRDRVAAAVARNPGSGTLSAAAPIAPGDYLGELLIPDAPKIERGQKLTLVTHAGVVTIAREVTALQPASATQQRLFVSTAEGDVFSAPVSGSRSR